MNRLLSILVSLVVLFFLYLWITHLSTSPKYAGESDMATDTIIKKTPKVPVEEEIAEVLEKEEFPTTDTLQQEQSQQVENDEPDVTPPPAVEEEIVTPPPVRSQAHEGSHWVIAGNFLELANAEKHLKRMKDLGYSDAEIVHFELSEYHTVCAGKFADPTEARRVAKKITESHGIDTYVRQVDQ